MDALRIPYKYELTQVLTPHLNDDGDEVPEAPKRRTLMSKITLLPKSRYKSCEGVREGGGGSEVSSLLSAIVTVQ